MAQVPMNRRGQGGGGGGMVPRRERSMQRPQQGVETLFDRLFSNWLAPFEPEMGTMRLWDFDVTDNDREIIIRAEMPGFEDNEIDIQLANEMLVIRAEEQQRKEGREEFRSFYRAVTLPSAVDADKVQANYRNGVLKIHLPRAAGSQPRRISIQGGQQGGGAPQRQSGQGQEATATQGQASQNTGQGAESHGSTGRTESHGQAGAQGQSGATGSSGSSKSKK